MDEKKGFKFREDVAEGCLAVGMLSDLVSDKEQGFDVFSQFLVESGAFRVATVQDCSCS